MFLFASKSLRMQTDACTYDRHVPLHTQCSRRKQRFFLPRSLAPRNPFPPDSTITSEIQVSKRNKGLGFRGLGFRVFLFRRSSLSLQVISAGTGFQLRPLLGPARVPRPLLEDSGRGGGSWDGALVGRMLLLSTTTTLESNAGAKTIE